MVGYHLMTEGHSIQLGSGRCCESTPPTGPGQHLNINNTIFRFSYKITTKSQPLVPYKVVPY